MPELPEVETVMLYLESLLVGRRIVDVRILNPKSFIGDPRDVSGKTVAGIRRFGKMLVMDLDSGMHIGVHLKMSGQLVVKSAADTQSLCGKHMRIVVGFDSGSALVFNDQRMFGWMRVMKSADLLNLPFIRKLAPEPWDISDAEFYGRIHRRNRPIKSVILDQEIVAGPGNIYANDALWDAHIRPDRKANSLTRTEASRLRESLVKILREGIRLGGSTGKDRTYVHPDGSAGSYQKHFRVYDRAGKPCLRNDGGTIGKMVVAGRGTYLCPVCQK